MLLSRKFGAMIGGSLEMDLTFLQLPLKDGTTGRLLNVPLTETHVNDVAPAKNEQQKDVIQTLQNYYSRRYALSLRKKILTKSSGPRKKNTNNF
jgi:hypothetical protein